MPIRENVPHRGSRKLESLKRIRSLIKLLKLDSRTPTSCDFLDIQSGYSEYYTNFIYVLGIIMHVMQTYKLYLTILEPN
uniref:Uncharacterized protein n=1 Tax=Setaria italica TaxID=4555 RepID=K3ZBD8_SETIT